jgi:putative (di)nucleoside polyphosphate hydrolase
MKLPYRKNVSGIVFTDSEFLIVQGIGYKKDRWKFPAGGIEEGETKTQALLRELEEELGTTKFKIVSKSKQKYNYNWSKKEIEKQGNGWRGQTQSIFLVEFVGKKPDIKMDPKEIQNYKWIKKEELKKYFKFPHQYETFKEAIKENEETHTN